MGDTLHWYIILTYIIRCRRYIISRANTWNEMSSSQRQLSLFEWWCLDKKFEIQKNTEKYRKYRTTGRPDICEYTISKYVHCLYGLLTIFWSSTLSKTIILEKRFFQIWHGFIGINLSQRSFSKKINDLSTRRLAGLWTGLGWEELRGTHHGGGTSSLGVKKVMGAEKRNFSYCNLYFNII